MPLIAAPPLWIWSTSTCALIEYCKFRLTKSAHTNQVLRTPRHCYLRVSTHHTRTCHHRRLSPVSADCPPETVRRSRPCRARFTSHLTSDTPGPGSQIDKPEAKSMSLLGPWAGHINRWGTALGQHPLQCYESLTHAADEPSIMRCVKSTMTRSSFTSGRFLCVDMYWQDAVLL